jgi:hypothetical protein
MVDNEKVSIVDLHDLHKRNGGDKDTIKQMKNMIQIYHTDAGQVKQSMLLSRDLFRDLVAMGDEYFRGPN